MSSAVQPSTFRGTSTQGSFYFCIEGLPSCYSWQDLKDLIRRHAAHGIWTEMAAFSNGRTGETGWARVQRWEEAHQLFEFLKRNLVNGRQLRVHLFDTTSSPPQLLLHTCSSTASCPVSLRATEASGATTSMPTQPPASPSYSYTPTTPYPVARPTYSYPASSQPQQYISQGLEARMENLSMGNSVAASVPVNRRYMVAAYPQQQQQTPYYMPSPTTGTAVNVGQGAIRTEVRGVFVSNIDFKAKPEDILRHFGRAGQIVKCQLQKDPVTDKSKGNATVQYATTKEAKRAVDLFNDEKWMSMRLKVRLDRAHVAVSATVPSSRNNAATTNSHTAQLSRPRASTSNVPTSQQLMNSLEPTIVNGSMR